MLRPMNIAIVEPDDGSQIVINGKLFVMCDCDYTEKCPNGRQMGSDRCLIRIDANRLRRKEVARLKGCQR